MTPEALRDLIQSSCITQARAAELAGVKLRTMLRRSAAALRRCGADGAQVT